MPSNYIPQIDYTSRDYEAIRADLLDLASVIFPEWKSRDDSDFGVILVELFSYMGDIINYYIDRSANEAFLTTASQRASILEIARMLDYSPSSVVPSSTTLTFTNTNEESVTIPKGTQIATGTVVNAQSTQVVFETAYELTVEGESTGEVKATHGETYYDQYVGDSLGKSDEVFLIPDTPIVPSSVVVTVAGTEYTRVDKIADSTYADPVFELYVDEYGKTYIKFGDGISGRVPAQGQVFATYTVGGGTIGNVSAGTLTNPVSNLSAFVGVSVTNGAAATGGADFESNDSIRRNIPTSFKALNRAVSLKDYGSVAAQLPDLAKANAVGDGYNSVSLYAIPNGVTEYSTTFYENVTAGSKSAKLRSYKYGDVNSLVRTGQMLYIYEGALSEEVTLDLSGSALTNQATLAPGDTTITVGTTAEDNPIAGNFVDGQTYIMIVDSADPLIFEHKLVTTAVRTSTTTTLTIPAVVNTYSSPTIYWVNFVTGLVNAHAEASAYILTSDTDNFKDLQDKLYEHFTNKTPPSTTLSILPAKFVPVNLTVTVNVLPQYTQKQVKDDVSIALSTYFAFENVLLNDEITQQDLLKALYDVKGTKYSELTLLKRGDVTPQTGISTISCAANEIPKLGTLTINLVGGLQTN